MRILRPFSAYGLHCGIVLLLAGCASEIETSRSLVDSDHRAAVLVEEPLLSNSRSIDQNRLLRGWRFIKGEDQRRLVPHGSESVVEFVNLGDRPRRLIIDLARRQSGDGAHVRALVGNRELGSFPLSDHIEIELPVGLPLGRVAFTLSFSNPDDLIIESLSITPNLVAGTADFQDAGIEQRGFSIIEIGHRIEVGDRFVAEFQPPEVPEQGQYFAAMVEDSLGGLREVFTWEPVSGVGSTENVEISVPLVNESGPVRIGLVARGEGPAARWLNPRIVGREPQPAAPEYPPIGEPPRLVVLYVMDALRSDHVGHLGRQPDLTPTLDRLAAAGVSFTNHFAVAPNTPPSTRALFSGLCMLDDRQLPTPGPRRLAEVFDAAGYRTVSITGNPHLSPTLDLAAGFDMVEILRVNEDHHPDHAPTVNNSAEILHEAAIRWIDDLTNDERGFLYIHTMNPHNPYTPPRFFEDRFAPIDGSSIDGRTRTLVSIRDGQADVGSDDIRRLGQLYAAGVAYNDAELGAFLQAIEKRLDPSEVLVVVTSDHGEELFEHQGVLHGYTLYDEMLRIPLIIRWPGHGEGRAVSSLTNTLDLHATLVELVENPKGHDGGSSLWPLIDSTDADLESSTLTFAAAPGLDGGVMARSDRWKLIAAPRSGPRRGQGHGRGRSWDLEYVFNLMDDPGELSNLAGTPDLEVAWLRTRLMAWVEAQRALQPSPGEHEMDSETKSQLEALGYMIDN